MDNHLLETDNKMNRDEIEEIPSTSDKIPVLVKFGRGHERIFVASYTPMAINQCVINEGTDEELLCRGYRETLPGKFLFYLLTICTLGLVLLVFYWKPEWKVWLRARAWDIDGATHLIVRDHFKQNHVKTIKCLEPVVYSNFNNLDSIKKEKDEITKRKSSTTKQYFSLSSISNNELHQTRYFEHKFHKYVWHHDSFLPLRGLDCDTTVQQLKDMNDGLNEKDIAERQILFGENSITIEITPLPILLFREILNPYYAFQLFAIIVWCAEEYYSLPAVMIVLSLISISLSLYLTRKQNRMIHDMSSAEGKVRVLVNGEFQSRDSTQLLPGDVIEINHDSEESLIWCDCVLLSGNCVVSESMLTGESVPVLKTPLVSTQESAQDDYYDPSLHKQHTLYGGTKVVDVPHGEAADRPRALVIRTGFYTEKGKMIESMLEPSPMDYRFYNDSLKFILVMAIIGLIGSILTISFLAGLHADAGHIVKRVLDLITTVVPPGLPAALTVATIYAQRRLSKAKIFCISPPRIAISGKINCMCFDKTGTLTESDLKLWGVVPCTDTSDGEIKLGGGSVSTFHGIVHDYHSLPRYGKNGTECLNALATCHSLVTVDGKVSGDPIDLELFRATNWRLRKSEDKWSEGCSCVVSSDDNNVMKLAMTRVFQFNSVLRRMSVVTKKEGRDDMKVYVKGAPETIVTQCNKATVPTDFEKKLKFYTEQGYRVLALANRDLEEGYEDSSKLQRNQVETELNFLGLVVMTNPLKPKTTDTINQLKAANIRTVMATGDNLETAIFVARRCNMVAASDMIVVVEATEQTATDDIKISWKLESSQTIVNTGNGSLPHNRSLGLMEAQAMSTFHLAMTGKTLELIREHSKTLFYRVLTSATVLGRMKPDHKRHLVEGLQEIKYIVGMCGDGANDCGALKAAHSGIAIAEVKASIVSPFTSMNKDISCCIKLIREGRAALVTSFGMIKYLCIYCFAQYLALVILFTINSYLADHQFLFSDVGITGIVTLFFAVGGAAKTLSKKQPHSSLVSPVMLTCLLLQIASLVLFQAVAFIALKGRSWHTPLTPNMTHPIENIVCNENTVMFYTSCFQNMMLAFIFYKGLPYRQPLYRNVPYFVGFLLLNIWVVIMFFWPVGSIAEIFSLTQLNYDIGFKFILFALYVCNLICVILIEKVLLESESFRRVLKNISRKIGRIRGRTVEVDGVADLSYEKLLKQLSLDGSWPPVGQETTLKV